MGRNKQWDERMVAAFPKGTFKAIDKVLGKDEYRTDFIRESVFELIIERMGRDDKLELRKKALSLPAQRGGQ